MTEFLAQNWGNLASVTGLIFSMLAFVFAKRASQAAQQARDSVLRRSLGEDINGTSHTASELLLWIQAKRMEAALVKATDLVQQTSYLIQRWRSQLSTESRGNFLDAREQLRTIVQVLGRDQPEATEHRSRLAESCQRVSTIFSEERGKALRAADDN
jgi:hypothetical protein